MNRKNPTLRFVLCCCIVFPLAAIVMTYSRSSWLSLAVAAVVFVYYVDKRLIPIGFCGDTAHHPLPAGQH